MIIDCVLDKLELTPFEKLTPGEIEYIKAECLIFEFDYILTALKSGSNEEMKKALCNYIDNNEYNPELKYSINCAKWF